MPTGGIDIGIGSALTSALGATAGGIATGALEGAAAGGLISGVTGGNVAKGIEGGAITGGFIPVGGDLIGGTVGDIAGGAVGGLIGSEVTGGKPLTGALTGAAGGAFAGLTGTGGTAPDGSATAAAPGGASAAGEAATAGAGGIAPVDPTAANADVLTSASGTPATGSTQVLGSDLAPGDPGYVAPQTTLQDVSSNLVGNQPTNLWDRASNWISSAIGKQNPLTLAVGGGGLAYDLIKGNQMPKGYNQLVGEANQLAGQGSRLSSYLQNGTLPPGAQAQIDEYVKSATAGINSKYASMGIDPNTSTAAQQEIANLKLNAQAQSFNIADSLLKTGITESQISGQLFNDLIQMNQQQNTEVGNAISSFTTALALNGLKIPGGANAAA